MRCLSRRRLGLGIVALAVGCGDSGAGGVDEGTSGATTTGTADPTGSPSPASGGSEDGDSSSSTTSADESTTGGLSGPPPEGVVAIAANETVGLDWDAVTDADAYRIYWATAPGVTPGSPDVIEVGDPGEVHRALSNGTTYYYVITAVVAGVESEPSTELEATPGGEWALEELGHGVVDDILTGEPTAKIPLDERNHILMFAEGYTRSDLVTFHDHASHAGARDNDVDRWTDLVFSIAPYDEFREAFVVWTIPRASNTDINAANPDTAWAVPVDVSNGFPGTETIPSNGETATRTWEALADLAIYPSDFEGGGFGSARTHTAAFLIYDPDAGEASVSGRALSLINPADDSQRLSSGFGVGHAHEFTHAFAALRDEYLENDNSAPSFSLTSNVTNTMVCGELPWEHLLAGSGFNETDELVGAFGVPQIGYHSELLCLMNGTHDNAQYYGGSGRLRVEDRLCNFCREMAAYRTFRRGGIIDDFDTWVAEYRDVFYERFGFFVPDPVPQTNDVVDPGSGTPIYEGCASALPPQYGPALPPVAGAAGQGCIPPGL